MCPRPVGAYTGVIVRNQKVILRQRLVFLDQGLITILEIRTSQFWGRLFCSDLICLRLEDRIAEALQTRPNEVSVCLLLSSKQPAQPLIPHPLQALSGYKHLRAIGSTIASVVLRSTRSRLASVFFCRHLADKKV